MRNAITTTMTAALLFTGTFAEGGLPDIFQGTEYTIVEAQTIKQFPAYTFLENITIDDENTIYFTSYIDGLIYRKSIDGVTEQFAKVNGNIAGIIANPNGGFIVSGCNLAKEGMLLMISDKGEVTQEIKIEKASHFLNGITLLNERTLLMADSDKGVIWQYDLKKGKTELWLENTLLESPLPLDAEMRIGANGVKIFDNSLYVTNTQKQMIVQVPITKKGEAGEPKPFANEILGDDFTIDSEGNFYVATHPYNAVVRITPEGEKTIIANELEGVTGCTAAVLGKGDKANTLFVVTNGGIVLPPKGGVRGARVVNLNLASLNK